MNHLFLTCLFCLMAAGTHAQDPAAEAEALLKKGLYNEARAMWERVIGLEGRTHRALLGVGKSLFYLQENGRSDSLFAEAWGIDGTRSEPLVFRGLIAERRSQRQLEQENPAWRRTLQDAVRFYRAAAKVGDDAYRCHYWASEALLALGMLNEAIAEIAAARSHNPDDKAARLFHLRLMLKAGRLKEAVVLLESIKEPVPEELLVGLSAQARLKEHEKAKRLFVHLLQSDMLGDDPRVWVALFSPWTGTDDRSRLQAVLIDPSVIEVSGSLLHYFTGELGMQQAEYDVAVKAFGRYVKLVPNDPAGWARLAAANLANKTLDKAATAVANALPIIGADAGLMRLGQLVVAGWVEEKEFDRGAALQKLLLEQSPDDLQLLQGQGALLKETGRLIACESLLRRVLSRDDLESIQRAQFLNDLALCVKGAGRNGEALELFQASADESAFSLDARENLASLLMAQGKEMAAKRLLNEVLLMDPDRARARYYKRALSDQMR